MNDNAPVFDSPLYTCQVSEGAARGQFVTMIVAADDDEVGGTGGAREHLKYAIVGGNDLQAFKMEPETGERS